MRIRKTCGSFLLIWGFLSCSASHAGEQPLIIFQHVDQPGHLIARQSSDGAWVESFADGRRHHYHLWWKDGGTGPMIGLRDPTRQVDLFIDMEKQRQTVAVRNNQTNARNEFDMIRLHYNTPRGEDPAASKLYADINQPRRTFASYPDGSWVERDGSSRPRLYRYVLRGESDYLLIGPTEADHVRLLEQGDHQFLRFRRGQEETTLQLMPSYQSLASELKATDSAQDASPRPLIAMPERAYAVADHPGHTLRHVGSNQWIEQTEDGRRHQYKVWMIEAGTGPRIGLRDDARQVDMFLDLNKTNQIALIRHNTSGQYEQLHLLQTHPAVAADRCKVSVQHRLAWDQHGTREWPESYLDKLCRGASNSDQPGACFAQVYHGGKVARNGGFLGLFFWPTGEAIELCQGTTDAARTIGCFDENHRRYAWYGAVELCKRR